MISRSRAFKAETEEEFEKKSDGKAEERLLWKPVREGRRTLAGKPVRECGKTPAGGTRQRKQKNTYREEPGRESVRERMGKNDEIIDQAEGVFLDGHL